jgi:hypothetical protein
LFAAAINIGTVIFIASQEPYINESDSQMMTLSQELLAIIIACGTGSTEISAGNSAHQTFVIAVVFGLAIPGTILLAYSVVDPDLSWAKHQWENRCAWQTKTSSAVHPSEGEQPGGKSAHTESGQMQAGEQEEKEEREQGGPEGAVTADGDPTDAVTCIASLEMQEGGTEDAQETFEKNASTNKKQMVDSLRRRSLAAVNADQEL